MDGWLDVGGGTRSLMGRGMGIGRVHDVVGEPLLGVGFLGLDEVGGRGVKGMWVRLVGKGIHVLNLPLKARADLPR